MRTANKKANNSIKVNPAHGKSEIFKPKASQKPTTITKKCGTDIGFYSHVRRGEKSCEPCRNRPLERVRIIEARRAALKMPVKQIKREPTLDVRCGTRSGYRAHAKRMEIPCESCKLGSLREGRIYRRENFASRKVVKDKWRRNNIEKSSNVKKIWDAQNYIEQKEKQAVYRNGHREGLRARNKKYRKENKDKMRRYGQERRARIAEVPSESYSAKDIIETYGTLCHICNLEIDLNAPRRQGVIGWENGLHLDHVVPLSMGGTNLIKNIRPSHGICNLRKSKSAI